MRRGIEDAKAYFCRAEMLWDYGMAHGEPELSDMERVVLMCDAVEGVFDKEKREER